MFQYNTVEEALEALRNGEIILVTDDEDRENEGDMICAAEFATTENVNFMAAQAKGLICMPMSIDLCNKLHLGQMVDYNTDNHLLKLSELAKIKKADKAENKSTSKKKATYSETKKNKEKVDKLIDDFDKDFDI